MSIEKPFEKHQRDVRSFMDLDHAEQDAMDPARIITDELVQVEGFSEEQANEIALESGQDWSPPPEDELIEESEEMETGDEIERGDGDDDSEPN